MGNQLTLGFECDSNENCALGAYVSLENGNMDPTEDTLRYVMAKFMDYRKDIGKVFGSDVFGHPGTAEYRTMRKSVDKQFLRLTGKSVEECKFDDHFIGRTFIAVRKQGWKRDTNGLKRMPEVPSTLYAHTARLATVSCDLIKLGYTSQNVHRYLQQRKRKEGAKLLATKCGGIAEETVMLSQWQHLLRSGREYFECHPDLIEWLRVDFEDFEPTFEADVASSLSANGFVT